MVPQEAGGQNISRSEVHLKARQVAAGDPMRAVLAARQTVNGVIAVENVGPIVARHAFGYTDICSEQCRSALGLEA